MFSHLKKVFERVLKRRRIRKETRAITDTINKMLKYDHYTVRLMNELFIVKRGSKATAKGNKIAITGVIEGPYLPFEPGEDKIYIGSTGAAIRLIELVITEE